MADQTQYEGRIKRLELQVAQLALGLRNALTMARRALENSLNGNGGGFGGGGGAEVRRAIVTSAFLAGSSSAAAAGQVTLQSRDSTSGAYSTLDTGIACWNGYTSAIPTSSIVYVAFVDGAWEILTYNCP